MSTPPTPEHLSAITATRALAYGAVTLAALVLLAYLYAYVRSVLADTPRFRWWYMGAGVGAGVVYGGAGLLAVVMNVPWAEAFMRGAGLFFMLLLALSLRSLYGMNPVEESRTRRYPSTVDTLVLTGFIAAWWASFLTGRAGWTTVVEIIGWLAAVAWVLRYGVAVVTVHEGTSIAAIVRHLLPALVCFTVIVFAELLTVYLPGYTTILTAVAIVGTVLVAAFLFNTAVAIRQQAGEVERLYDWTTWRGG